MDSCGEIGGCCKSSYCVLTLVREKSVNFKVDLLCEPCIMCLVCQDLARFFTLFYCIFDSSCGACDVISLYVCVTRLMDLFVFCVACLTESVNCLVKQFAICLGVVVILLLNVMEVFSVGGGAQLHRPCMVFQRMCVLFL